MYLRKGQKPVSREVHEALRTTTLRAFEGGLNAADTDLNMSPKFAKILDNFERNLDGSLSLRPGTRLRATLSPNSDTSDIVNIAYFNGYIISVQKGGTVSRTDGAGTTIWMDTVDPADRWTVGFLSVNFTIFNSDLIMVNGHNKPLIIVGRPTKPGYMQLDALRDLGTAGEPNINVPIGSLVCTHGRYTVHAGIPSAPSTIVISSKDTSGTYPGDAGADNDAITLDLGTRVSLGDATITGLISYRDKLIVTFERGILPVNLGVYTGSPANHAPTDDGFISESGCLTHRSLVNVGDDTYFCDNVGVNSVQRVSLLNTLRPRRVSYLVDKLITAQLSVLSPADIQQNVFAVYDLRNSRYMLFVPIMNASHIVQETVCYSYTAIPQLQIAAWARLRGWKWRAACRTALQNIYFCRENKLYTYEFDDHEMNGDLMGDSAFNSIDDTGVDVAFDWELPWADFDRRLNSKTTRYLHVDTEGSAKFTALAYADNMHVDPNNTNVDTPMLELDMAGGSTRGWGAHGWGIEPWGDATSSDRPTNEERLYAFPLKANLIKLRFKGATRLPLKFISLSIMYLRGSIRRA